MGSKHRVEHVLPASNPRFIQKAAESDADVLFLDLEDAVATSVKVATRQTLIDAIKTIDFVDKKVFVRPNNLRTKWAAGDYYFVLREIGNKVTGVTLPKVVGPEDLRVVDQILTAIEKEKGWPIGLMKIEALIELPSAILQVREIARIIADAGRGGAIIFGLVDYTAATGGRPLAQEAQFTYPIFAKRQIVEAAQAAGIDAIDGVTIHVKNYQQTKQDAIESAKIGFTAKWSLHPEQIRAILDADREHPFTPSRAYRADQKPKRIANPFPLDELSRLAREEKPIIAPELLPPRRVVARRSLLLIPAQEIENSDLFIEAFASEADEIVIDVGGRSWAKNEAAGRTLSRALKTAAASGKEKLVAFQADLGKPDAVESVRALLLSGAAAFTPNTIFLRNVKSADDIRHLESLLQEIENDPRWPRGPEHMLGIEAPIESQEGLARAYEIALASPRVESLIFAIPRHETDFYAKGALLAAASAVGIDAVDYITESAQDVANSAEHMAIMGYSGKVVRRLEDVATANQIFSPAPQSIERALEIVELYRKADIERGLGAIVYVDKHRPNALEELVDAATVKVERRILAVATKAKLFTPEQTKRYHTMLSWGPGARSAEEPCQDVSWRDERLIRLCWAFLIKNNATSQQMAQAMFSEDGDSAVDELREALHIVREASPDEIIEAMETLSDSTSSSIARLLNKGVGGGGGAPEKPTADSKIRKVSILGAGEIGAPLTARMARYGVSVALATLHLDTLAKAEKKIQSSLDFRAKEMVGVLDLQKKLSKASPQEKAELEAQIKELESKVQEIKKGWADNVSTHQDPNYQDLIQFLSEQHPDFIMESVREELLTKQAIFHAWVDKLKSHDGLPILATTTSSLSVAEIAMHLPEPLRRRFIGFHPFNPPDRMDLVEIVYTPETDPEVVRETVAFAKSIGLQPVLVKDSCSFIVNRVLFVYLNEAAVALQNGEVSVEQLAQSMLDFGFPMDPLRLLDFVGTDVSEAIIENLHRAFGRRLLAPSRLFKLLLGYERYGNKTNRGFYGYAALKPLPETEIQRLAAELEVDTSAIDRLIRLGLEPDQESLALLNALGIDAPAQERLLVLYARYPGQKPGLDKEILKIFRDLNIKVVGNVEGFDPMRLTLLMANEAARIVEEGIASVADVDLAMDLGIRFPDKQGAGVRFGNGVFAITRPSALKALQAVYPKTEVPKRFNAGPFGWLLRYGIENAVAELEAFARWHGARYQPASLLCRLQYGQIPELRGDNVFAHIPYKRAVVKPRGLRGPATEIFEEGIVPTKQQLGGFQLRARVLVGDINANWKWAVRDYPIDIAKYHQETGTVGGSAGLVMVTEIGKDLQELGQMKPGDIGIMLSGKHDVLTTEALGGSAQAHRSFRIHAYEAKDALEGSYSQEVVLDWSQFVRIDGGAYPFEDLGGVGLVYPTVEHAWNVLNLKKGSLAAMEGAIGATGGPGVQTAKFREASVIGIVSSTERGRIAIETYGSDTFIDRTKHLLDEEYVTAIKERVKELTGYKRLLDKVLAYSGQGMFRKHVLSVREADPMSREDFGGEVAYFGAGETGFALEIPGTGGDTPIEDMFERVAKLRRERYRVPRMRRILIIGRANEELRETIEIAKKRHSDVIVVVFNRGDEETVKGWNLLATKGPWPGQKTHDGIVNLQVRNIPVERMPDPPRLLPDHPTPEQVKEFQQCSEAYAAYQRRCLIPFGKAIGAIWGVDSTGRPLGPDVDFVLVGGEDGENILNYLKFSGFFTQIAYPNDTSKMTLRWHGALGWMNQNSIVLTKKAILGAHYASPSESAAVIDWIMRGAIRPAKARWFWPAQIGVAQEGMGTGKNVILVGVSRPGLKTLDEAYESQEIHPLIARLSYGKAIVREQAAEQIYERGLAMAREALEAWGQEATLKPLVFGPPVVGVAVEPERFAAIRDAWNEPELAQVPSDQDVEEFEISVRGAHLDILTPKRPAAGEGVLDKFLQKHGENIQQVELWTSDVVKATEILIDRARQGLGFKPIYEVPRPGANGTLVNFTLFSLKDGRKLLVELVQLVPGVKTSQPARVVADTDVRAFAKASGDRNPFHLDNGYAQASRYGTRIAHGVLTASLVLASLERFAPGHALSAVEITKFTAPVKISDAVIPQIEVIELNNGSMRLKIGAVNQDGKPLFEGQAEVKPRARLEHAVGQTTWTEPGQLLRWAQAWARDVKPFEVRPAPDFQVGDHGTYRGDLPESQALHITEETINAARALFGDANPHLNELIGIGAVAHTSAIFAPGYILLGARADSFSKPIKVGDTLTAQATVTDLQTTKSGKTIIKISIEISNQRGDHVLTGEVTKIRADETAPLPSKN